MAWRPCPKLKVPSTEAWTVTSVVSSGAMVSPCCASDKAEVVSVGSPEELIALTAQAPWRAGTSVVEA